MIQHLLSQFKPDTLSAFGATSPTGGKREPEGEMKRFFGCLQQALQSNLGQPDLAALGLQPNAPTQEGAPTEPLDMLTAFLEQPATLELTEAEFSQLMDQLTQIIHTLAVQSPAELQPVFEDLGLQLQSLTDGPPPETVGYPIADASNLTPQTAPANNELKPIEVSTTPAVINHDPMNPGKTAGNKPEHPVSVTKSEAKATVEPSSTSSPVLEETAKASPSTPAHPALEKLQAVLDKLPPEAKDALKDVMDRLNTLDHPGGLDKATAMAKKDGFLSKSIQQVQLEALMEKADIPSALSCEAFPPVEAQESVEFILPETPDISPVDTPELLIHKPESTATNDSFTASVKAPQGVPPHEQIVKAARMSMEAQKKEIAMHLNPHELGEVRLTLHSNHKQEVSATIITETLEAKAELEKHVNQLLRSLEDSGIRIGKITILQSGNETSSQFQQQSNASDHSLNSDQAQQQSMSNSQQNSQQSQQAFNAFMDLNSNSFKDEGSSLAGGDASSHVPFDTDVEGEEVQPASRVGQSPEPGSIDIRI